MSLGLKMIDAMFAVLLGARSEGEALIVMNGLKLENVARRGFHVYRQINPDATLGHRGRARPGRAVYDA